MAIDTPAPGTPTSSVWRVPLSRDDVDLLQALVSLRATGQTSETLRARLGELDRKLGILRAGM